MNPSFALSGLPESLRPDARDAYLPVEPPQGFRNMFHDVASRERDRWRGLGTTFETEPMLAALAERMVGARPLTAASPFPAGFTYLAQFAAHDMQFSSDPGIYPPSTVPVPALRRRRLMLETIYGEGPDRDPHLYGMGADWLAPYRLRVGRFGPGAPVGQRTLARTGCSGHPDARLCAADGRNDQNPVVAQIAGFFMRLHNVALRRLERHGDGQARFEAARRVTRAAFRRIVFGDLMPRMLRADVLAAYETGRRLDRAAADTDDMPAEFSDAVIRAGHALVRPDYVVSAQVAGGQAINVREMLRHTSQRDPEAFRAGRDWAIDWSHFFGPAAQGAEPLQAHVNVFFAEAPGLMPDGLPRVRRAHMALRDLTRGMEAGLLRVGAIAEALRPAFEGTADLKRWLAFDASHRGAAVLAWIGDDRGLRPFLADLVPEPPLYLFALIEAAAPADQGGGGGRGFGAIGSSVMAEPLFAARDATRHDVEDHPDLADDCTCVFGEAAPPPSMERLIALLIANRT
jgi:hypothetical protein